MIIIQHFRYIVNLEPNLWTYIYGPNLWTYIYGPNLWTYISLVIVTSLF